MLFLFYFEEKLWAYWNGKVSDKIEPTEQKPELFQAISCYISVCLINGQYKVIVRILKIRFTFDYSLDALSWLKLLYSSGV